MRLDLTLLQSLHIALVLLPLGLKLQLSTFSLSQLSWVFNSLTPQGNMKTSASTTNIIKAPLCPANLSVAISLSQWSGPASAVTS